MIIRLSQLMQKKLLKHKDGFKREDKSEKIDYTLIPLDCLEALASHYTEGAKIHGVDNWKKCKDMGSFKRSLMRHIVSILKGETNEDHFSSAIWNIMALQYNKLNEKQ